MMIFAIYFFSWFIFTVLFAQSAAQINNTIKVQINWFKPNLYFDDNPSWCIQNELQLPPLDYSYCVEFNLVVCFTTIFIIVSTMHALITAFNILFKRKGWISNKKRFFVFIAICYYVLPLFYAIFLNPKNLIYIFSFTPLNPYYFIVINCNKILDLYVEELVWLLSCMLNFLGYLCIPEFFVIIIYGVYVYLKFRK